MICTSKTVIRVIFWYTRMLISWELVEFSLLEVVIHHYTKTFVNWLVPDLPLFEPVHKMIWLDYIMIKWTLNKLMDWYDIYEGLPKVIFPPVPRKPSALFTALCSISILVISEHCRQAGHIRDPVFPLLVYCVNIDFVVIFTSFYFPLWSGGRCQSMPKFIIEEMFLCYFFCNSKTIVCMLARS